MAGELEPGRQIAIEEVAALLGVSRTPVREALPALQQLGLLEARPGGLRVTLLDHAYVKAVYGVRSALESLAIEVTAGVLSDADLTDLRSVGVPESSNPEGDLSEMIGPDLSLHDFIRERCPLPFLNAMLDSVRIHRTRLVELEHTASREHRKASLDEHERIIEALEERDGRKARRLMQAHLDRVGREVTRLAASAAGDEQT